GRRPGGAHRVQRRPGQGARRLARPHRTRGLGALLRDGLERRHAGLRPPHPRLQAGLSRPRPGHGRSAVAMSARRPEPPAKADPLEALRSPQWLTEARRKAIHLSFLVLPLELLLQLLPWPRTRNEFRLLFLGLTAGAVALDVLRIHERRVRTFFRQFFGELLREHERMSLLGSTYLLLAALIAIEVFPQPVAGVALGYTVLGDAMGALVGRAWGRHRFFNKSWEGV